MKSYHCDLQYEQLRKPAFRWAVLLFCLLTGSTTCDLYASESDRAKRVLIISMGSRLAPGFAMVDQQLLQALAEIPTRLETYAENLDIVRFPTQGIERIFSDYLTEKYAQHTPDLIILVSVGNLVIAEKLLERLFPQTPIIVAGLSEENIRSDQFGPLVTGFVQRVDPRSTLELILRLQPETRRIVVISGTAEVDRAVLNRVKNDAPSFAGRVNFDFWENRSMAELRHEVSILTPQTTILVARVFRDGAGQAFISTEVGLNIAQWANAPVYTMTDATLGTGAVGGSMLSIEAMGKRAGELAQHLLSGIAPASLPFEIRTNTVPMFDWRALRRWGIREERLPSGSVVRFKPPSIWDQYRWYVIGALIIILVQGSMIADLLLERRRRRSAEAGLLESQQFMELATEAGGIGLWVRDLVRGNFWANPRLRSLLGFGDAETLSVDEVMARVHPGDRATVMALVARSQVGGAPFDVEFRTAVPAIPDRWLAVRGKFVRDHQGELVRRMGTMIDITERKVAEQKLSESEENFRRLVESTAAVLWQADLETWVFTYVAPQAVKLLGYPLEQWYEKDFWVSHLHPDDRQRAVDTCMTRSHTDEEFEFDYRMIKASGELVWVRDIVNCQQQNGQPKQLRGLMFDITERKRSEQAILESEERFRTVANAAPVMIWMSGADKLCTFFNKGWLDFTGRTLEQELGDGWTESVHKEDLDRSCEIYRSAVDVRQEYTLEYRLRRRDGAYCWILSHGVARVGADGTFLGYIGTAIDITERKRAEEKFRLGLEAAPSAILMVNGAGQIVLVNVQAEKLFGYTRAELIGQSVEVLVPERLHTDLRAAFFSGPEGRPLGAGKELSLRRKNGSEVAVEIGLSPIETEEGLLVLTWILDISARKEAEHALNGERQFLRQIIDINPNLIFAKDREGRFTLANVAVADVYGTVPDNLVGKMEADFNPRADEVESLQKFDSDVINRRQECFIAEERITDSEGRTRWLQTVKRPIINPDGSVNQVLGTSTDITQRKATELELREHRAELAHVARISTMGELAASLAHELNQPLTAILANAQAALRFLSGKPEMLEDVRETLQDIVKDNSRAGEVIRRMRALVKKGELEFASLDFSQLIREVVLLVHSDAILLNINLEVSLSDNLPPVRGDKVQLQQVVLNLLLNAFDAMKDCPAEEREVELRVQSNGLGFIETGVRDCGTGLSGDTMDKIFQPFYSTKRDGLGMGLSICRSIIASHGGRLWAENNSGHGATFYFTVPVENCGETAEVGVEGRKGGNANADKQTQIQLKYARSAN